MKKSLSVCALFLALNTNAQLTSGKLVYEVSEVDQFNGDFYNLPSTPKKETFTVLFNADYMQVKSNSELGYAATYLHKKSNTMLIVTAPAGSDSTISFYSLDFSSSFSPDSETDTIIVGAPESKKILGYNCRRTIYEISNGSHVTVWTTNEIKNADGFRMPMRGIEGETLMECVIETKESTIKQVAIEVTPSNEELGISTSGSYHLENPDANISELGIVYSDEDIPDLVEFVKINGDPKAFYSKMKVFIPEESEEPYGYEYEYGYELGNPTGLIIYLDISETGKVTDVHVLSGSMTDGEQKKLIKLVKKQKWTPAKLKGKAMPSFINLNF